MKYQRWYNISMAGTHSFTFVYTDFVCANLASGMVQIHSALGSNNFFQLGVAVDRERVKRLTVATVVLFLISNLLPI